MLACLRSKGMRAPTYLLEVAKRAVADEHRVVLHKSFGRLLRNEDDLEDCLEWRGRALDVSLVGSEGRKGEVR